jgi:hypothetical protein
LVSACGATEIGLSGTADLMAPVSGPRTYAQVSRYPWKDTADKFPPSVRHIRTFSGPIHLLLQWNENAEALLRG